MKWMGLKTGVDMLLTLRIAPLIQENTEQWRVKMGKSVKTTTKHSLLNKK